MKCPEKDYEILKLFSEGEMGWLEASTKLKVDGYTQLLELLYLNNLPEYSPDDSLSDIKALRSLTENIIDAVKNG